MTERVGIIHSYYLLEYLEESKRFEEIAVTQTPMEDYSPGDLSRHGVIQERPSHYAGGKNSKGVK